MYFYFFVSFYLSFSVFPQTKQGHGLFERRDAQVWFPDSGCTCLKGSYSHPSQQQALQTSATEAYRPNVHLKHSQGTLPLVPLTNDFRQQLLNRELSVKQQVLTLLLKRVLWMSSLRSQLHTGILSRVSSWREGAGLPCHAPPGSFIHSCREILLYPHWALCTCQR